MEALLRHERIAFQLSGGKDSVAALFLLRAHWGRLTVYFCDGGDTPSETQQVVSHIEALVPRFVRVAGRVLENHARYGLPTDLLPWSSAPAAHHHNAGETPLMQDRVACCSRSIMAPLHERMVQDGITLIIRGQKDADSHKGQFRSGDTAEGFEFLYPVQSWTDAQCMQAMRASGVPVPGYYEAGLRQAGDCATCTAWCEPGKAAYLAKHDPIKFVAYRAKMNVIAQAVAPAFNNFYQELEACHGLAI